MTGGPHCVVVDSRDPAAPARFRCAALGRAVLEDPEGNEFCVLADPGQA